MTGTLLALFTCAAVVAGLYLTDLADPDGGTVAVQVFAWVGGGLFYRLALHLKEHG